MGRNFKPNRKGLQQILNSEKVGRALQHVAEEAERHAVSISTDFRDTGEYQGSFQLDRGEVVIRGQARQTRRLANTSGHAAAVEFGNAATKGKGHHVLARTLDHLTS